MRNEVFLSYSRRVCFVVDDRYEEVAPISDGQAYDDKGITTTA